MTRIPCEEIALHEELDKQGIERPTLHSTIRFYTHSHQSLESKFVRGVRIDFRIPPSPQVKTKHVNLFNGL